MLLSHAHQDHWGLIKELPPEWDVWSGANAGKLIRLTAGLARKPVKQTLRTWTSRSGSFEIGPFRITPYLTDHSAFDAYMLLIESNGRRIFYSGDFRRHGRKASLVEGMIARPPRDIDVLILEGTNLGTEKPVIPEDALENEFLALFKTTKGRVFISWSGQNIDRTVTIYRAAKRAGRTLAIDLYTADVLDQVAGSSRVPQAGFPNLTVVITKGLRGYYAEAGREDFISRMARHGISADKLASGRHVIMLRKALIRDYGRNRIVPTPDDAFVSSMWKGYVEKPGFVEARDWCARGGAAIHHLHTSGHASPQDLRAFAAAIGARAVIPVHGENWDSHSDGFDLNRAACRWRAMERGIGVGMKALHRSLADLRLSGTAIDLDATQRPRDEAEGYEVQCAANALLEATLGPIAGHKIGCTTPVMQAFLNIPSPCSGDVFASTVRHGNGTVSRAAYRKLGIECEIVAEIGRDVSPDEAPFTRDSIADAVGAVMAGIEIVDDRYRDYRTLGVPTLIADNFFNAGCVLGEPVRDWKPLNLAALAGRMLINGIEVGRGTGAMVLGHPLAALAWLANARAGRGLGLTRGRFVFLGSLVETKWLEAGDRPGSRSTDWARLELGVTA